MWSSPSWSSTMVSLPGILSVIFVLMTPTVSPVTMTPQVNVATEQVTVTEGKRVILPCTVDSEDQEVIWVNPRKILISLKDRRIIDDQRISVERPFVKVWNLLIRTVRFNDSGIYECRVNTTPRQIKKVKLEVQVPPSILSEMSSDKITVTEGETATIICNVTGIPAPNVTWYKRNYRLPTVDKERIGEGGEILKIKNISRHCDDIYECTVDNGVPPAVSKAIRVVVQFAPEVVVVNKQIKQKLGKETILDCQIYANPQGVTAWFKNGREIRTEYQDQSSKYEIDVIHNDIDSYITLALRIRDLTEDDFGEYDCAASNFLGDDKKSGNLARDIPKSTTTTTTTTTTTPALIHVHPQHQHNTDYGSHHSHNNRNRNNYNDEDYNNNNNNNNKHRHNNNNDYNNGARQPNQHPDHRYRDNNHNNNNNDGMRDAHVSGTDRRYDSVRSRNDEDSWPGPDGHNDDSYDGGLAIKNTSSSLWIVLLLLLTSFIPRLI